MNDATHRDAFVRLRVAPSRARGAMTSSSGAAAAPSSPAEVVSCAFNQDASCLAIATTRGFKIYRVDAGTCAHEDESLGSVRLCAMLFSTSLVAVCGTGSTPSLSPRVCKLLNTSTRRCIADLAHASTILAVRMDRHALVVVEATRATVYSMQSLNVQRVIDTIANPRGIVALSACERSSTLALPSLGSGGGGTGGEGAASRRGGVVVHDCVNHLRRVLLALVPVRPRRRGERRSLWTLLPGVSLRSRSLAFNPDAHTSAPFNSTPDAFELHPDIIARADGPSTLVSLSEVDAHRGDVAALALNERGTLLASASTRGTIVRVFALPSCDAVCSFRRGALGTVIRTLRFASATGGGVGGGEREEEEEEETLDDGALLAASSETGTVHVFRVDTSTSSDGDRERDGGDGGDDAADASASSTPTSANGGAAEIAGASRRVDAVAAGARKVASGLGGLAMKLAKGAVKAGAAVASSAPVVGRELERKRDVASAKPPPSRAADGGNRLLAGECALLVDRDQGRARVVTINGDGLMCEYGLDLGGRGRGRGRAGAKKSGRGGGGGGGGGAAGKCELERECSLAALRASDGGVGGDARWLDREERDVAADVSASMAASVFDRA